jgi:hypothetical protein
VIDEEAADSALVEALREILDAWDKRATAKPIEQVQALIPAIIAARYLLNDIELRPRRDAA